MEIKDWPYEMKIIDGKHLLFYKGEKLPDQVKSKIEQDADAADSKLVAVTITFLAKINDTK